MSEFPRIFKSAFTKYSYIFPFIFFFVFIPVQWHRTDEDRDVYCYYLAAERVRDDVSMYEPHPSPGPFVMDACYYLYPPFFGSALSLGPQTSFATFARLWLLVVVLAYWTFAASLGRIVVGRTTLRGTLVAGAALLFVPGVIIALNLGQAEILVWAMVGVALAYPGLRGMGLMAAALTKVNGIWPLAVAVWRERSFALLGAGIVATVAIVVAVVTLGPRGFAQESIDWFTFVVPALSQGKFQPGNLAAGLHLPFWPAGLTSPTLLLDNLSLSFAPLLLAHSVGGWTPDPGNLHIGLRLYLSALTIAGPVAAGWVFRRQPIDLHCALVLSAAFLFAPILRPTSLPLVLLPAVIYFAHRKRGTAETGASAW